MRTFTLNSPEFYEAVTDPRERPWIPNGALPREPRVRDQQVIVEPRASTNPLPAQQREREGGTRASAREGEGLNE